MKNNDKKQLAIAAKRAILLINNKKISHCDAVEKVVSLIRDRSLPLHFYYHGVMSLIESEYLERININDN